MTPFESPCKRERKGRLGHNQVDYISRENSYTFELLTQLPVGKGRKEIAI